MEIERGEITSGTQTISQLLERKEIHQIGGAREIIIVNLKSDETAARSTEPFGDGNNRIGTEVRLGQHYNEAKSFFIGGKEVMAVREDSESPKKPSDSNQSENLEKKPADKFCICYCERLEGDTYAVIPNADIMENCQDPSYQGEIRGKQYLSVVNTKEKENGEHDYWVELYELNGKLKDQEMVAKSPELCKGLHIIEGNDDKIHGFIRPQRGKYGRGKIAYFTIDKISELREVFEDLENKSEVIDIFDPEEWGGINDLHLLPDGHIGVIGHIARMVVDENNHEQKEYFVTASIFDPETREMSDLKIIMTLDDLKDGNGNLIKDQFEPKREGLKNVLYPTNSVLKDDKLEIYAGVKDVRPFVFTVENPWQDIVSNKNKIGFQKAA